ncbi:MAG: SCO family protein, partial [Verrucomicrobia bacterium]|nr:SCO family protein [Verrucomicrobiota bacterium]
MSQKPALQKESGMSKGKRSKGKQRIRFLAAGVIMVALLSFWFYSWRSSESKDVAPLPFFGRVPDFSLVDQNNRVVTLKNLQGQIWVADIVSTRNGDSSNVLTSRFAELDRDFKEKLRLVTFTLDPGYDTALVLKKYAQEYEATDHWMFLTGPKRDIDNLVFNGFHLRDSDGKQRMLGQYQRFAVVDGDGFIRGYYDGTSNEVVQNILTDVG